MYGKKGNNLIIIENGQLTSYMLDDKNVWEVGRPSKENIPDIKLHSATVSRRHGKFQNLDGEWFYLDYNGKNGTVYNQKHIRPGINGRVRPVMLEDGDLFVFGGGEKQVLNYRINQRIIAGNAQFTGIAAGRGVGFTTGLLLLREGLGMRETPIRPHSWH